MINASLARSLEEGGLSRSAARDLVAALDRGRPQGADPWMLAYAALLTTLLVGGFGWTASQLNALDARTNARIDALNAKVDALDAKVDALDAKVDGIGERLVRLETLISERLPPPD